MHLFSKWEIHSLPIQLYSLSVLKFCKKRIVRWGMPVFSISASDTCHRKNCRFQFDICCIRQKMRFPCGSCEPKKEGKYRTRLFRAFNSLKLRVKVLPLVFSCVVLDLHHIKASPLDTPASTLLCSLYSLYLYIYRHGTQQQQHSSCEVPRRQYVLVCLAGFLHFSYFAMQTMKIMQHPTAVVC